MENYDIVDFGTLANGINFVIGAKLKLSDKKLNRDDGSSELFHTIYFDVTTYKNKKCHYNSDEFITIAFDNNGKFMNRYSSFRKAFDDKLQVIKNEIIINNEQGD